MQIGDWCRADGAPWAIAGTQSVKNLRFRIEGLRLASVYAATTR